LLFRFQVDRHVLPPFRVLHATPVRAPSLVGSSRVDSEPGQPIAAQ
jgi:hypothetical protein